MQNHLKAYLAGVGLFLVVLLIATTIDKNFYFNVGKQTASAFDPTTIPNADIASGFAWNDNVGWINFGTSTERVAGRVYVSNNELYGYAWGENIGWISLNCLNDDTCGTSDYGVTQNSSDGILTGYAWGENIGWINFAPTGGGVTISRNTSDTNTFSGYAWGENIGWISFSGTSPDYGVTTAWTRTSTGGGSSNTITITTTATTTESTSTTTATTTEQTVTTTETTSTTTSTTPTLVNDVEETPSSPSAPSITTDDGSSHTSAGPEESTGGSLLGYFDVSQVITENIASLGTTTTRIYLAIKEVMESEAGAVVTNTVTTAGVVGGGIAASGVFALGGITTADLLFLPFRLWGLLMSILGLKKRNRPWGTVYDSVTKQPIDPAYVTVKRADGKDENTSITDLDGRYGFLVAPGKYVLTANKTNYSFPSKKMSGKTTDVLYKDLYLGGEINILTANMLIDKDIPIDPVKFDWNEFVKEKKKLMKFYSSRDKIIRIITDWIFKIGFVVSIFSLFLVFTPYNLIIIGLYILLALLKKFGVTQKALGALTEKDGDPFSFAIVRVFSSDLNVEITHKVANKIGQYYCLVPKGNYYIKIEKKNNDESYSLIHTSEVFAAENGIINKNFVI